MHVGKDVAQRIAVLKADAHRQIAEQQAHRRHVLQILTAIVDPGDLHIGRMVVDGDGQGGYCDEEFIAADLVGLLHGVHLRLQNAERGKEFAHLVFSGVVVGLREARPLDPVVTVLKVLPALLIEGRVLGLFTPLQHQIIEVRIRFHAHIGLADVAHEDLQRGAVEHRVMHVEEYIAGFFRFKHSAAVESSSDDLERVDHRVPDKAEFKLRHLLHMDVLQELGVIALYQLSVLVPGEFRQQGRVV